MKVSELIEHLMTLDLDAIVCHEVICGYEGETEPNELEFEDIRTGSYKDGQFHCNTYFLDDEDAANPLKDYQQRTFKATKGEPKRGVHIG